MQRELVERARGGDKEAFGQLVRAGFPRLKGVAYLVLRDVDRAEDAVQEALLRDGSSPSISANTFNRGEIHIDGVGMEPTIEGNHISATGNSSALWVTGASRPQIAGNTIQGAAAGIEFIDGAGGDVVNNELSDNGIGISVASLVGDRSVVNIRENVIRGGNLGIATSGPVSPQIVDNDVSEANRVGVRISTTSSPVLTGNHICDNAVNLEVDDRGTPQVDGSNEICEDAPSD